ncbi:hypothetical protein ACG9XR_23280 [Acinetobacter guillouiae]|uniref:HTH cro/C1-type domain-containing protein n=2 Tax=Acinetobacter TaxID=469 RepID=N8YBB6_ACIGI|nr:hypothetical protein [Acinetobacter guillouiae]ENV16938.1 hypothetical protein F964_02687 [Acinetobacter guillouiae NIPH 991]KAF1026108.1 MAG: hypothetical protein GAK29_01509 [Acinetobacter bereziniae]
MNIDDLKAFYEAKSDADLSKKLNRPRCTIFFWKKNGIPPRTQATFEVLTKGELKADLQALSS